MTHSTVKTNNKDVVLIVDDDDSELYLAESILKYLYEDSLKSLEVLTAYNSDQVEELIDNDIYIDLVLMDINLPSSKYNGIEVVKKIRLSNGDDPPPIVGMLTTSTNRYDISGSIEAKADFYLEKTEDINIFEKCFYLMKKKYLDSDDSADSGIREYFSYIRNG